MRRLWDLVPVVALVLSGMAVQVAFSAEPARNPEYRIGIDDVLGIHVWDNKDVDQTIFVRPDGKISLPLAGEIDVRGMTVAELEGRLSELYSRKIKHAQVTVIVREIRSRPIFFIGGVGKTGPMQLTQEWTLLQAISAAGGLAAGADLEGAYVLRDGKLISVNFTQLIQKGDLSQNVKLQPGDTIVVPVADQVYLEGDVKRPGAIKYTRELTLLDAIAQAGGITDLTIPRRVSIIRGEGGKKRTIEVNVDEMVKGPVPDMPLRPNDTVVIALAEYVYIEGDVKKAGPLRYTKHLTLLDAIAQAGGFTDLSVPRRVSVVRGAGDKKQLLHVNVSDLVKGVGAAPDVPLRPTDIVVVTVEDVVYVQGEVRAPTTMKFSKDLTMLKAVAQAGGFTNLAAGNRVTLVRGEGATRENTRVNVEDMMKGEASDIPLKPNDIVIVPQRLW